LTPRRFKVVIEWDSEGQEYVVRVPALPGCATHGRTKAEALERAREAIEGYIEALAAIGESVRDDDQEVSVEEVEVYV